MVPSDSAQIQAVCDMLGCIDGLVQERRNSIANAMELGLSCTNPSVWFLAVWQIDIKDAFTADDPG